MIQTNCSKCGADLILHEGYGVCSSCGEIIGFDIEEEPVDEIAEETTQEAVEEIIEESAYETAAEAIEEIKDEAAKECGLFEELPEETKESPEDTENAEEEKISEDDKVADEQIEQTTLKKDDAPKKSKVSVIILLIAALCILAVLAGIFIPKIVLNAGKINPVKTAPVSDIVDDVKEYPQVPEISEEVPELTEETQETEKTEEAKPKEELSPTPPVKTPKKSQQAVITDTPSISYRIRKEAGDSSTQIGAFSDLERAKAFAQNHAADGYKVYDMSGNIVYEP